MPGEFPIGTEYMTRGKTDKRYSLGLSTYVARFCDKWLGAYHTAEEARAACAKYDESRWLVQA